jgi:hypothetical protein
MSSNSAMNLASSVLGVGGALGAVVGIKNQPNPNGFDNTSDGLLAFIVIIVLLAIVLFVLGAIATYRLTGSALQVVLYLLLGNFYLIFAWIYYGMTRHKLVKMSRA